MIAWYVLQHVRMWVLDFLISDIGLQKAGTRFKHTAETQRAQSKPKEFSKQLWKYLV
jgi:hypothetical protein